MTEQVKDSGLTCPACGYDITALTSNRCPECGEAFVVSKPGMQQPARSNVSNSMPCPDCGYNNTAFMPRACVRCDHRFTIWQRIFGVGGRLG